MEQLLPLIQSQQYDQLLHQCSELEPTIALAHPNPTFYGIFMITYLIQNKFARAVYFRAPPIIQEDPEIKIIKSVVKAAWNRDYVTFYTLITEAETGSVNLDAVLVSLLQSYRITWQARTLALLSKAYTSIPPAKVGEYLGLSNDLLEYQQSKLRLSNDALVVNVLGREWVYDTNKNLLSPPKERQNAKQQEADFAEFARLTEIAMALKGR